MAVRAEQLLEFQLSQLPEDHPERPFIKAQVDAFAAYNAARKDAATPQVAVAIETTPIEVRRFSQEAKEALRREGYAVYELTGQSIASVRDSGRKFWTTWHRDYPDFEALTSMHSEVAINPAKLFLPKSNNKTLVQQEDLIARFSEDLGTRIQGVEAIMGEAPDYVDLAFARLNDTGDYLFGERDGYNYARTKTPTVGSLVAGVGLFDPAHGLGVYDWARDDGHVDVFAAPLVVPKA